jgi:hypothetical protein
MFAYILIGLELAILFAAFWYVFIREPRPHRINSAMWGTYEVGTRPTDCDTLVLEYHNSRVPRFAGPSMMPANYESEFSGVQSSGSLSSQDLRTLYSRMSANKDTSQYGWVLHSEEKPTNPISVLLTNALGWFERLSTKLP